MLEKEATPLNFWDNTHEILHRLLSENGGVICTVMDNAGNYNAITLGWGLIGPFYHKNPIFAIAVCPPRYSWRFLEEVDEFVIAVPDDSLLDAAKLCGSRSGRDIDKFEEAAITPVKSVHVRPPSIMECPINIECRTYAKVPPPHMLLTPEHRMKPVESQHTIYFGEVLGTFTYRETTA